MGFLAAIRTCFSKYFTFSGRASRSEYWWFFLFLVLLNFGAALLDWSLFSQVTTTETEAGSTTVATSNQPIQSLAGALVFVPHLAVAWRRMHDSGKSGLYALFPLLLLIGALSVLVFGIGLADLFASGGQLDILFTRLTVLAVVPTLLVLLISPLLMLWWLTRRSEAGENRFGPEPREDSA